MILATSTSSPRVCVAIRGADMIWHEKTRLAPRAASQTLVQLIKDLDVDLDRVTKILVDLGPGSFTGVKVGVTFAKVLAWSREISLFGVSSFDLISLSSDVAIPSKKNEWYLRRAGENPVIVDGQCPKGACGFDPSQENPVFPSFLNLPVNWVPSMNLDVRGAVPQYIGEPSISIPKKSMGLKNGA